MICHLHIKKYLKWSFSNFSLQFLTDTENTVIHDSGRRSSNDRNDYSESPLKTRSPLDRKQQTLDTRKTEQFESFSAEQKLNSNADFIGYMYRNPLPENDFKQTSRSYTNTTKCEETQNDFDIYTRSRLSAMTFSYKSAPTKRKIRRKNQEELIW